MNIMGLLTKLILLGLHLDIRLNIDVIIERRGVKEFHIKNNKLLYTIDLYILIFYVVKSAFEMCKCVNV